MRFRGRDGDRHPSTSRVFICVEIRSSQREMEHDQTFEQEANTEEVMSNENGVGQ